MIIKTKKRIYNNKKNMSLINNKNSNMYNGNGGNINYKNNNNDRLLKPNEKGQLVYSLYNSRDDSTIKDKETSKNNKTSNSNRCMCINYQNINDGLVSKTYDRCTNTALNNSDFCELHQDCQSYLRKFLSGSEPEYQPKLWADPYIESSHNCYSYFLNRQVKAVKEKCNEICEKKHKTDCPMKESDCSDLKPQPGDFQLIKKTGSDKGKERIYQCPNMQNKILSDNPTLKPIEFNATCPKNYYKGAMVVDPDNTYHFYRMNKDATWSHKPGISKIANKDASGKNIYVPHFADRDYSNEDDEDSINYTNFCGYYCIPKNTIIHKNLA